ncbi:hypothetical protein BC937DRAFT_90145 [Endogone sp. FLAS-F59071]|nr:hypothetical protein BC937DRAFT_90145 [Endogone sp. FLAS-F59071]|eukprot:RUS17311.1 hypothetical protein BC937DRAFT_90145 [Endogone sp. FLAS-F59071]
MRGLSSYALIQVRSLLDVSDVPCCLPDCAIARLLARRVTWDKLKTLVSLHQAHSPTDADALTEDEVTIIGAVLDLRDKPISVVMTPMEDVFTLSSDHVLDEKTVDVVSFGFDGLAYDAGLRVSGAQNTCVLLIKLVADET